MARQGCSSREEAHPTAGRTFCQVDEARRKALAKSPGRCRDLLRGARRLPGVGRPTSDRYVAAKAGLHNACGWLNRKLGRPDLAFADLIDW